MFLKDVTLSEHQHIYEWIMTLQASLDQTGFRSYPVHLISSGPERNQIRVLIPNGILISDGTK